MVPSLSRIIFFSVISLSVWIWSVSYIYAPNHPIPISIRSRKANGKGNRKWLKIEVSPYALFINFLFYANVQTSSGGFIRSSDFGGVKQKLIQVWCVYWKIATLGDLEPRSPLPPRRRPGRLKDRQSPRVSGGAGLGGDAGRPDCLHAESTIVTM